MSFRVLHVFGDRLTKKFAKPIEPMYASIGNGIPTGRQWTFEPKYDGVRVLAHVTSNAVALITRNGNDKAHQFPEIADALAQLARWTRRAFVVDGEIVALVKNAPARFQTLQGRMHLKGTTDIAREVTETPTALMLFDILVDGDDVLLNRPWAERRKRLQQLVMRIKRPMRVRSNVVARRIRLTPSVRGNGKAMVHRARQDG